MKKVETINDEKTLTISEEEFYEIMSRVTATYINFQMELMETEDLNIRWELAQDYGLLTFALKSILFEEGDLKNIFEENSDYTEEDQ